MVGGDNLRLRLLGPFAAARDPDFSDPIRISSKKACAVLAFLAMSPQQSAGREQIATLLWANSSDQQARQSLRQALLLLRKDLGPACTLEAGSDLVGLRPGTVHVDALEFEALAASSALADLEQAVALIRGEFLAGFSLGEEEPFEGWLGQQRRRFETAASGALERFARQCDSLNKGVQAMAAVERLLALDPLREDWQRLALRLFARHRSHNEALAQAKVYADLLRRELDVEPEPQTQALVDGIRRGAIALATPPSTAVSSAAEPAERGAPTSVLPLGARAEEVASPWHPVHALGARTMKWPSTRLLTAGGAIAASAISVVLLVAAVFTGMNGRSISAPVADQVKTAMVMPADPWQSPRSSTRTLAEVEPRRAKALIPIVVLPFKTYGEAAGSTQLLADMMTDDLINILSRVPGLRVISRQTSRAYRDQITDVAAIGAELQVLYILDGSMRMHAGKLRVNVELIDPNTRLSVWTGRIEREGGDRHGVQDEIVGRLARELQFELYPIESERRSKDADADTLAYRGWAEMHAAFAHSSAEAFGRALDFFTQALEREPQHTSALMGVGAYHTNMGAQRLDAEPRAHFDKAWDILQKVARQSPTSSAAHHHMGLILQLRGDMQDALDSLERSVEINPSNAGGYAHIGHTLTRMGKAAEGLEHVRYAMRLSPRDPNLAYWLEFAGCSELELGRFQQAIEYFARSRTLNPGYPRSLAGLVAAHALAGNMSQARAQAEKLKSLAPDLKVEALIERYSRAKGQMPRQREGLRLALKSPPS